MTFALSSMQTTSSARRPEAAEDTTVGSTVWSGERHLAEKAIAHHLKRAANATKLSPIFFNFLGLTFTHESLILGISRRESCTNNFRA